MFMGAFRKELELLYKGVNINVAGRNEPITVRGIILCGTCDLPAKSTFLNMSPHMSVYGCRKCEIASQKKK